MKKASKVVVGDMGEAVPVEKRRGRRVCADQVAARRARMATAAAHAAAAWRDWYVLMVASGREIAVQAALHERIGAVSMVPLGVRWQRVMAHVQARTGQCRERVEFVLMDGYVFVEGYDPRMLALPHVFGFVGADGPMAVSACVLARFAAACGRHGSHDATRDDPADPALAAYQALAGQVGRMVSVTRGPFAGQVGLLTSVRPVGLASMAIRIMGREVRTDVAIDAVDVVGAA